MRILQVVHGFPPERRGGTEVYTHSLSRELGKKHEVHIFYPGRGCKVEGNSQNEYNDDLHSTEHLTEIGSGKLKFLVKGLMGLKHTYMNTKVEREFEGLLDAIKPDVVHFQHLLNLSASLIEVAKSRGLPVIVTLHDFWFICPIINLLKTDCAVCQGPDTGSRNCFTCYNRTQARLLGEALVRYHIPERLSKGYELFFMAVNSRRALQQRREYMKSVLRMADKLIAPSMFLKNMFIQNEVPGDKIIYSRNGYDLSAFEGFEKREKDGLVFGFAGGVARHKGVHVLIEAFNRVENENVKLRIYGTYDPKSNYFRELRSMIRNDNVEFVGRYTDVRQPYSGMDVLVVPSICYETGGPLVVIEALVAKTPVIASNIGCIPEFVEHGVTGLLFETGIAEDLLSKIRMLVENPGLIKKFKSNIKPVKTVKEQGDEMEAIYEAVQLRHSSASF